MNTDIHGIIQVVIAVLELILAIYLFKSRVRGHIIYSFTLFIFGVALWVFGNGLYRLVGTNDAALWWMNLNHLSAGIIAVGLLYFSYAFPYQTVAFKRHHIVAFIVPLVVLGYLLFGTNTLITKITGETPNRVQVIGQTYVLFALWFLIYMGWAFFNLIRKYRTAGGASRRLQKLTLLSLLASFILGSLFDLFFPLFGGPQLFYVGTESSIIWLGVTTYIVIRR